MSTNNNQNIILSYFKTIQKDGLINCKILEIVKATNLTRNQAAIATAKLCKTGYLKKICNGKYVLISKVKLNKTKAIDLDHIDDDYFFEREYLLDNN